MLVSVLPVGSFALTTDHITLSMDALRASDYPDKWYWCGGDPYKSIPQSGCAKKTTCYCNSFNNAFQCHGFALIMAHRTIGSYPAMRLNQYKHGAQSNGWQCYTLTGIGTAALCGMGLQPGDIVRASATGDYSDGHTAIVWKVDDGKVYFAESWGSVYSKINWGPFNGAHTSMQSICSAYSYVALWRNPSVQFGSGQCPHIYKEGYEVNHPHRKYTSCIYCQKTEYTGEYQQIANCVCCNGTHSFVMSNEEMHPHRETGTCSMCGYFTYSGKTSVVSGCPVCRGVPYDLTGGFEKKLFDINESIKLEYNAENAVGYDVTVKKDSKTVLSLRGTQQTSVTLDSGDVGTYIAEITAYSKDKKTLSVTTDAAVVTAPISDVETAEDRYIITYSLGVSYEDALDMCMARSLTLETHAEDFFTASFKADTSLSDSEYIGSELYAYIHVPLPYHEAVSFCRALGGTLAAADDFATEAAMVKFCADKYTDGVLLGANDEATEGIWLTEEGRAVTYFNWNISHNEGADRFRNYMFMFPGGSMTHCYAATGFDHGFVLKISDPFTYIENEDGTLTIKRVKGIESSVLELPEYHEGKAVTGIATDAFANGSYREIIIPKTIVTISDMAFYFAQIDSVAVYRDSAAHKMIAERFDDMPYRIIMPFDDVAEGAWYYEGVRYCYERSYISGISETLFSPAANITREQFVMMLSGLAHVDLDNYEHAETTMTDVPSGRWYTPAVAWAVSEGYVSGVGEGLFGTGQNITREQIARLLYLYTEKNGGDVSGRSSLASFHDADKVSSWAYENVSWAVDAGIISGLSASTLAPGGLANRAQTARIFMVYDNKKLSSKE